MSSNKYVICNGELYHYGVLGMKWGVQRAKRLDKKAARAKKKGNMERAEMLSEKSRRQKAATERVRKDASTIYGKKAVDRAANQSIGKNFIKNAVLGDYGSMKYNQYITQKGTSRGEAFVKSLGDEFVNDLTFGRRQYTEEWRL